MIGIDVLDLRGYKYGDYTGTSAVFLRGSWLAMFAGIILRSHLISTNHTHLTGENFSASNSSVNVHPNPKR